jgi:hypothetical protein
MKDKTIAILEGRMRDHIAGLVRKYGARRFRHPRWPKFRMWILLTSTS